MRNFKYVSLFSGGGIGDLGFKRAGFSPVVMNELEEKRAELVKVNYPMSKVVVGDIVEKVNEIANLTRNELAGDELFMISATPPCQGMSKNGIGSIKKAISQGKRPAIDHRNYLYRQALQLVDELKPIFFVWENVDRMFNTVLLNDNNEEVPFVEEFSRELDNCGYVGRFEIHNMAEYGIAQNRRRAIGVFVRKDKVSENFDINTLFPNATNINNNFRTVEETIGNLPALDSKNKKLAHSNFHPLHYVPVSRPELYYWIENTLPNQSAFENNICPDCGYVSEKEDIYCLNCGKMLPKPTVFKDGEYRLIKGFVSTYKRMRADEPAPTVTTRSAYACSDKNLHPTQNRVLSLYEIALLFGIDPDEYIWQINGKYANATLLRDILGEPVTPVYTEMLANHLKEIAQLF